MARGDFAKAFSRHRQEGGTLTRREFANEWNKQKKEMEGKEDDAHNRRPLEEQEQRQQDIPVRDGIGNKDTSLSYQDEEEGNQPGLYD